MQQQKIKIMNKFFPIFFFSCILTWSANAQTTIKMEQNGGVFYVPGEINGLPLKFIFDTGASNVFISLTEAAFMLKNGYLESDDFSEVAYSQIANGEIVENAKVLLKEVKVGPISITDVTAMVNYSLEAPLLLGQSAIQKLGPIQLDGDKLIIVNGKDVPLLSEQEIDNLCRKSFVLLETGDFAGALEATLKSVQYVEDENLLGALYNNLGIIYSTMDDRQQAIEAFKECVSYSPSFALGWYNLGDAYYSLGDYDKAETALLQVLRINDSSQRDLYMISNFYLGEICAKDGKVKDAERYYRASLATQPTMNCYLGFASFLSSQQRYKEAIELYEKGLEYEPYRLSNIKRYSELAFCYFAEKQYNNMKKALRGAIDIFFNNSENIVRTAMDSNSENNTYAMEYMSLAFDAMFRLARLSEEPEEIIASYSPLWKSDLTKSMLTVRDYLNYWSAYNDIGDGTNANIILEDGLSKFPDEPNLLFIQSLQYNGLQKIEILQKILKNEKATEVISFDYGTVNNNIAWETYLMNRPKEALPYALKAVNQNPEHGYSWETLGEIYYALENYSECITAMTRCIELNESSVKAAYEYRIKCYRKLKNRRAAERDEKTLKSL